MPSKRTLTITLMTSTALSGALALGVISAVASPASAHRAPRVASSARASVSTHHKSSLGTYLVDGHALYLFEKDTKNTSHCNGGCASEWPPLLTSGSPKASHGVKPGLLGTTTRRNGKHQVTYDGHPLYYFAGDTRAAATHGQDVKAFGAKWYVLNTKGHKIDPS
jgi:predicted lipoprotein with Yx(FWY)xxD motif